MKNKVFFLAFNMLVFTFGGVFANASVHADAPATETIDPMSLQKAEDLLTGKVAAADQKEMRKIDKVKAKMDKLAKKIKKSEKRGDIAGLLVTIGIILMIIGLVGIILSVLGIGSGLAGGGGGALVLGLILYLIGKYAF